MNEQVGTPPTRPGSLGALPRREMWPGVVGVICIVYGAISVVSSAFTLVFLMAAIGSSTGNGEEEAGAGALYPMWQQATMWLSLVFDVAIIVAGAGLVGRRRWSPVLAQVWAWVSLIMAIIGAGIMLWAGDEILEAAGAQGGGLPASNLIVYAGAIFGFAFAAALPVFLLIWLRRPVIRAQMAKWS